jgi:predicted  nucleic acid-binding Zn-ribbon protein
MSNNSDMFFFKNNKTIEEYKGDYFLKLDENIKSFENEKASILNKIEILTMSNKKISDTLRKYETELNDVNNKFSIFLNFKRAKIKKMIERDTKIYNETFEKVTNMYEQIIEIEESIKKTKSLYTQFIL